MTSKQTIVAPSIYVYPSGFFFTPFSDVVVLVVDDIELNLKVLIALTTTA